MAKEEGYMTERGCFRIRRFAARVAAGALLGGCFLGSNTSPGTVVTGVVTVDGLPAPGVQVRIENTDQSSVATLITDANGAYRLDLADEGRTVVSVTPPPGTDCQPPSQTSDVALSQVTTVNFKCTKNFSVSMGGGHNHTLPGIESLVCWILSALPHVLPSPSLIARGPRPHELGAGASYSIQVQGPLEGGNSGIIAGQLPITGTLASDGTARPSVRINRFGTYRATATVTSLANVVRTATTDVTVTSAAGTCP
jgi:hypothetical protein